MSEEALRQIALQVRNWGKWGRTTSSAPSTTSRRSGSRRRVAWPRRARSSRSAFPSTATVRRAARGSASTRSTRCSAMAATRPKTAAEVKTMEGYGGSDDWIVMPLQCVTQWDSLRPHLLRREDVQRLRRRARDQQRRRQEQHRQDQGASSPGAACCSTSARHKGVRALEPGYAITVADLEATAAAERVEVLPGDILLVRTGHHVTLSRQERLAALRSRSVPGRLRAHRALAARQADRGHRLRQLRGGGPSLGDRRAFAIPSTSWRSRTWG